MTIPPKDAERLLETAWGVIANASRGDWTKEHPDWQGAAASWRDAYFAAIASNMPIPPQGEPDPWAECESTLESV